MASRLQYRRRTSEGEGSAPVDWEEVDEELSRVNPAFRDPRFDSLKHVLNVLSSENAEAEVEELRDQRAHIEELVDAVVEGYHAGFNKSIHNYSQILRLFTESKLQLESLRRSLESAKRRLSAQSRHLSQQWQRHITLSDTLRLLDDVQAVAQLPARLHKLEEGKEWVAAVALLLDGCNKLARQEMSRVGALAELKEEMGRRRASLQASMVEELEARIYKLDPPAAAAASTGGGQAGGAASNGAGVPGSATGPSHRRTSSGSDPAAAAAMAGGGSLGSQGAGALAPAPSGWGQAVDLLTAPSGLPPAQLPRRPLHRRAHTANVASLSNPSAGLAVVDGHLVDPDVPLPTLVDCLAQVGGVEDAQRVLRKHMPQRIRGVILRALELFPTSQHLPHNAQYLAPPHQQQRHGRAAAGLGLPSTSAAGRSSSSGGGGGGGPCGGELTVPPELAATAQSLVEHVLGCCLQVFHALVRLLHMLAHTKAPKPSSGLELLLAQQQRWQQAQQAAALQQALPGMLGPAQQALQAQQAQQQQGQAQEPQLPPAERAKEESAAAWEVLQGECEQLLGVVLDVQQAGSPQPKGGSQTDVPGEGWLAAVGALDPGDRGLGGPGAAANPSHTPGTLTFSLVHEVEELLPAATGLAGEGLGSSSGGAGPGRGGPEEGGQDAVDLVPRVLGGYRGGPALLPGLYRPVLQFVEAAEQVLATSTGSGGSSSGNEGGMRHFAQLFAMPWRAATDGGNSAAERSRLRAYVESFSRMEFLPSVYVDFRARCTRILEDGEAFRPPARLRSGAYQPGDQAGRPLLPAALATEQMVKELLSWAALMPPYASHLTGVVENILGRVLDAFISHLTTAVAGSTAGRLAEKNLPLVRLMAKEPSAVLLGSPVAFFMGGNTDAMESFVSSVISSGFGANDESTEREVLSKLMAERPLPPSSLLSAGGDAARLLMLAALSDSLDYVADVIQLCTHPSAAAAAAAASASAGPTSGPGGVSSLTAGGAGGGAGSSAGTAGTAAAAVQQQRADSWQARLMTWRGRGGLEKGLTEGLAHLADRYRAVAGACMRIIRLDLLLLVISHLAELPRSSYVCSEEEAKDVDECVGALARSLGRLDEELCACLPPSKRAYAFGSLGPAAARVVIWLLPELREINHNGVTRMCRMLASLQPTLLGVGGAGGSSSSGGVAPSRPEATRAFDKAKLYYTLLTYSLEGLLATVAEKPHRFSPSEYSALLAANVAERPAATPEQRAALQRTLTEAGVGGGSGKGSGGGLKAAKGTANAALAAFVKAVVKQ
ncbi:hypothetical protein N2152v2_006235 [Parachlorella kessleri]